MQTMEAGVEHPMMVAIENAWHRLQMAEGKQRDVCAARIVAVRELGRLLSALPTAQGRRDPNGPPSKTDAIKRLGIRKTTAYDYEAIASVPQEDFDRWLGEVREITLIGALRLARPKREKPMPGVYTTTATESPSDPGLLIAIMPGGAIGLADHVDVRIVIDPDMRSVSITRENRGWVRS